MYSTEEVVPVEEGEEWGSEESIGDEIEDAGAKNMSSDEDFVLEDEEGTASKTPTPIETKEDDEPGEKKTNAGIAIVFPQKRKADEANVDEESKQPAASAHIENNNDPCSISIQTAPLKLKKKRKKLTPVTDIKTSSISHVPAGLQAVKAIKAASVAACTSVSSVNTNTVAGSCIKSVASGGGFVRGSQASTNVTHTNTSSVRIHSKLPVILNKSSLSTVAKPSASVALPTSHIQSVTTARGITASKNLSSAATTIKNLSSTATTISSPSLQSQAHLTATVPGVGKVMFVTSTGVPLQVLQAVPVSQQPLIQGKTVVLGNSIRSSPLCVVSSSSSYSTTTKVSQQSLVQGKTLNTDVLGSTSSSTPIHLVSTSSLSLTPTVLKATHVSQQPLVQGKTLSSALPRNTNASSSVFVVSSPSSLSSSAGVTGPMQVLKAVPVSHQPLVQSKTLNTAASGSTSGSSQVRLVSPISSPSTVAASVLPSSSLPVKSTTSGSQLPSSPAHKVVISATPTNVANILSTAKQASHVATTSASSLSPSVILVQRPGTGEVVPLAVKGGTMVLPTPSASQQVVVLRPSNALASSTTPGTGISVLGNTKISQTGLGHKVILSPSTNPTGQSLPQLKPKTASIATGIKPFVQVAMSPIGTKPSEPKMTAVALGNKPVITTTVTALPTAKASTTTVTLGSNSTVLMASTAGAKPTCTASLADSENVAMRAMTSSEITTPNKQPTDVESHDICNTEVPHSITKALTSLCDAMKVEDKQKLLALSQDTDLKQNEKIKCEEHLLSSKTIPLDESCDSGKLAGNGNENEDSTGSKEKEQGDKNCSEFLLDLTCYETSVSDSAGCEESDDSAPNGLHQDVKKSPLTETDVKLCNGVACLVTHVNSDEEKKLDSVEQNQAAVANQTSNGKAVTEI